MGCVFFWFAELPISTFLLVATVLGSGVSLEHEIQKRKSKRNVGVEHEALLTFFFSNRSVTEESKGRPQALEL